MAARARARQAASLTALLNEDSLVLALAFACMNQILDTRWGALSG
jgi:hypothetical protein